MSQLLVKDVEGQYRMVADTEILTHAKRILAGYVCKGEEFTSPEKVKDYLRMSIGSLEYEVFSVLFLNSQHRMIACKEMFRGTLAQTSVYPREVVKEALKLNAGAVIFAHNHPSGSAEPSRADEFLTSTLKKALEVVDVRVLDHMVVTNEEVVSFAERGLL